MGTFSGYFSEIQQIELIFPSLFVPPLVSFETRVLAIESFRSWQVKSLRHSVLRVVWRRQGKTKREHCHLDCRFFSSFPGNTSWEMLCFPGGTPLEKEWKRNTLLELKFRHIFYVNLGMDMFIYKDDIFEFWNSTDSWEWAAFNSDLMIRLSDSDVHFVQSSMTFGGLNDH